MLHPDITEEVNTFDNKIVLTRNSAQYRDDGGKMTSCHSARVM